MQNSWIKSVILLLANIQISWNKFVTNLKQNLQLLSPAPNSWSKCVIYNSNNKSIVNHLLQAQNSTFNFQQKVKQTESA